MKIFIKIVFFLILLFVVDQQIVAQSHVYVDVAQVFSKFKFSSATNSEAPGSGYSTVTNTSFGFGYQHANKNGLLLGGGLNIRKAGSALVLNKVNYSWNLQYVDIKVRVGYQYNKYRIRPHMVISPYFSYLLNASQSVGLSYFDIKSSNSIKSSDLGFFFTPGINVDLSRYFSIYIDYNYILGLNNIETGEGQFLYNRAFALSGGILFNLSAIKTKENVPVIHDTIIQPQVAQNNINTLNTTIDSKTHDNTVSQQNDQSKVFVNQVVSGNGELPQNNNVLKSDTTSIAAAQNSLVKSKLDNTNNVWNDKNITPTSIKTDTSTNNYKLITQQTISPTLKKDTIKNSSVVLDANLSNANKDAATQTYKLSEQELKGISKVAVSKNIIFKIQLVALKNELSANNPLLKGVSGGIKKEKGEDGFYRYYTGTYKTYEKAQEELNKVKNKGTAKDAFIVAFKDGKKITVADAKKIVK